MAEHDDGERTGAFIVTHEHCRFAEFANAVRKHCYIGGCSSNRTANRSSVLVKA